MMDLEQLRERHVARTRWSYQRVRALVVRVVRVTVMKYPHLEADDLIQEGMLLLWTLGAVELESPYQYGFALKVLKNDMANRLRDAANRRTKWYAPMPEVEINTGVASTDVAMVEMLNVFDKRLSKTERRVVREFIHPSRRLKVERQKSYMRQKHVGKVSPNQKLSNEEIARVLEIPVDVVRTTLTRARRLVATKE